MDNFVKRVVDMWNRLDWSYLLEFITFTVMFYVVFRLLKENKGKKILIIFVLAVILFGFSFALSSTLNVQILLVVIISLCMFVIIMYNVEIKRTLMDANTKKSKKDGLTVSHVEYIINETVRAVQHMSKNDIGALIVLSNENLPEGIISSGTVINADINAPMIEAVFYPKAPLHDGAMIIEGDKIHAAGCFLPLIQNDGLPQEIGSRHRAALGVTTVASVTAIVVSEETGIVTIVKNGEMKKRYAVDTDLKKALSDYYWSDITAEE